MLNHLQHRVRQLFGTVAAIRYVLDDTHGHDMDDHLMLTWQAHPDEYDQTMYPLAAVVMWLMLPAVKVSDMSCSTCRECPRIVSVPNGHVLHDIAHLMSHKDLPAIIACE